MPVHIKKPAKIEAAGNKMKIIEEFVGMVNSDTTEVSITRMKSPPGWEESPRTPAFNEYSLVLKVRCMQRQMNKNSSFGKMRFLLPRRVKPSNTAIFPTRELNT